jgi:hypothetical protein
LVKKDLFGPVTKEEMAKIDTSPLRAKPRDWYNQAIYEVDTMDYDYDHHDEITRTEAALLGLLLSAFFIGFSLLIYGHMVVAEWEDVTNYTLTELRMGPEIFTSFRVDGRLYTFSGSAPVFKIFEADIDPTLEVRIVYRQRRWKREPEEYYRTYKIFMRL